jgi:mono/diheme cytochrome c family protein
MRRRSIRCLALLLAAFGVRSAGAQEMTTADVGRVFFQQYCASCHGSEGKGNGPVAETLKTPPPDLTMIAKRRGGRFPETEIAEMIDGRRNVRAHGSREMPVWGEQFVADAPGAQATQAHGRGQITLFLAYLRSIQQK